MQRSKDNCIKIIINAPCGWARKSRSAVGLGGRRRAEVARQTPVRVDSRARWAVVTARTRGLIRWRGTVRAGGAQRIVGLGGHRTIVAQRTVPVGRIDSACRAVVTRRAIDGDRSQTATCTKNTNKIKNGNAKIKGQLY